MRRRQPHARPIGAQDTLIGGAGNDTLDGGAGADRLVRGGGNDAYWVDNAGDVVVEAAGGGADRINTTINLDLDRAGGVYAHIEGVWMQGGGNLLAWGSAGNNRLVGNGANNGLAATGW